jgi:hypothetical protein
MALVCKNISKINSQLKNVLLNRLAIANFDKIINSEKNLLQNIHFYNNLKQSFSTEQSNHKIQQLETSLFDYFNKNINSKINFGNDGIFSLFKIFSEEYVTQPSIKGRDIVTKLLDVINQDIEMFKKSHLEQAVKVLSNKSFLEFKSKNYNFFRKSPKNKTLNIIDLKTNKYNLSVDIENDLIILTDKLNDNRHIIFAQINPNGLHSVNLYNSLIKNMNPGMILIEQEPFQTTSMIEESGKISTEISKYESFSNLQSFKDFLKIYSKENKMEYYLKKEYIFNSKQMDNVCVSETITNYALSLGKKSVYYYDLPFHNYVRSFIHKTENFQTKDFEEILRILSVMNLLEIISWISAQEALGCKNCASFLNKKEINWSPLKLEFLISKSILPNFEYMMDYKINRIYQLLHANKEKESVLILSNDCIETVSRYLELHNLKSEEIQGRKIEQEYDDFIAEEDFKNKNITHIISLALLLKENFQNYFETPPIKLKNVDKIYLTQIRSQMKNDYSYIYGLDEKITEDQNLAHLGTSLIPEKENEEKETTSFKKINKKPSVCEPTRYIQNLIKNKNVMNNFI